MSRGNSMSGANNIPLGSRSGGREGSLAQAAASLSGTSLLNPDYLLAAHNPTSTGSSSKFGPVSSNIEPPKVFTSSNGSTGFGTMSSSGFGQTRKLPNLELIASINATLAKKNASDAPPPAVVAVQPPDSGDKDSDANDRKRKRKSRWGTDDFTDKLFIPGMPTVLPANLSKEQEEAYLLQLRIEDASRRLRSCDYGIPANPDERSPSPEPIYSNDGKRLNTREFRKRRELEEARHEAIQKMLKINPDFKPPSDYRPPMIKVNDKVMIPQEEHPEINFVGLLLGPRGNTLKAMERETGAKIIIRGKGSVKEGKVGLKDGRPLPGEDEPLHAYITATNIEAVRKAVEKVKQVIREGVDVPEGQNDLRKNQLRELALLNGTLREGEVPRCSNCGATDHKSWQCQDKPNVTNNVVCTSCGGVGHIAKDCVMKRPGHGFGGDYHGAPRPKQTKIDEEYMSLMAELGEGPLPTPEKKDSSGDDRPAWQQHSRAGPGMFGRGRGGGAPRPLMGPSHGQQNDYGSGSYGHEQHERGGGWNNGPPGKHQNSGGNWGNRGGGGGGGRGGWKQGPQQQQPGPNARGQWNPNPPPPPPGSSGAPYGMPPPFFNAPPPPPPPPSGASGNNSWGWGPGPAGPVPPPRGPPNSGSYWGAGHGGWHQGPPPPPGPVPNPGLNLSNLIAAPPPPPPS